MQDKTYWLKCEINDGMLPGEYAIATKTIEGKFISLFAPKDFVDKEERLLKINILNIFTDRLLIYLPFSPFEIPSRSIMVSLKDIIEK